MADMPSIDAWLREAKADPSFRACGMYLIHNGTVRETPKAEARGIETDGVQPGDKVEENQVLLIIEAMKMETAITARTAGSVKKVLIKEGQPVKAKELLMELE